MTNDKPFKISGDAQVALTNRFLKWSGWDSGHLTFSDEVNAQSSIASVNHNTHEVRVNPARTILNPNRVLRTVNGTRLRQEAVLTGTLLHEAAHVRFTRWKPRTPEQAQVKPLLHSDGEPVKQRTLAVANLLEEARIEGRMLRTMTGEETDGLAWTLRASSAHHLMSSPVPTAKGGSGRVLITLTQFILHGGRWIARDSKWWHRSQWWEYAGNECPLWMQGMEDELNAELYAHLGGSLDSAEIEARFIRIKRNITSASQTQDDSGPSVVDCALAILTDAGLLPEGDEEEGMSAGLSLSCAGSGEAGSGGGEAESGGGEAESGEAESGEAESGDGEGEAESDEKMNDLRSQAIRESLAAMEQERSEATGSGGSVGGDGGDEISHTDFAGNPYKFRLPRPEDRGFQKQAEDFLRSLIDPTEVLMRRLGETPSAVVDGAAYTLWKKSGAQREPNFFVQSRRHTVPSVPVKIAVLVDISGSMEEMQKPSAQLSWALSTAALDLQNFAGRGTQVESTLIHWGSAARVVQENGVPLTRIPEAPCIEMTSALGSALELVDQQIPGFFDVPETPEHRLIIHFTDWGLGGSLQNSTDWLAKSRAAGVRHLSIEPKANAAHAMPPIGRTTRSFYTFKLPQVHPNVGDRTDMKRIFLDPSNTGVVWETAKKILSED